MERARAGERFRRPAIFQKVCARELAARVAEARGKTYSSPERAVELLESACQDDPGEPTFRLDLAETLPVAGHSDEALGTEGQSLTQQGQKQLLGIPGGAGVEEIFLSTTGVLAAVGPDNAGQGAPSQTP